MHHFRNSNRLIDLCDDGVFKTVFTGDSRESRTAITCLISAFLARKVFHVSVKANESAFDDARQRRIRYDIRVQFNSGQLAGVEMTVNPGLNERLQMEYYLAKLFLSQEIRGDDKDFTDLQPTYQLVLASKASLYKDKALFHRFRYYDAENQVDFGGRTAIHVIELEKARYLVEKPAREMTSLERWAVYFQYFNDDRKRELLSEIIRLEEGILMVEQVVNEFTDEQIAYFEEMSLHRLQMSINGQLTRAEKRGITIGEQLEAEKAYLEKLAGAKRQKTIGVPISAIAGGFNLPLDVVEKL
jgi:hypothetical protein